ncbi:hypothetical protein BDF22DRAFT_658339 [Syncephalis plumigaleata]|nr:hypothetical protein BDF22DRAFT_658339 [Syncephalis plumigaleata]
MYGLSTILLCSMALTDIVAQATPIPTIVKSDLDDVLHRFKGLQVPPPSPPIWPSSPPSEARETTTAHNIKTINGNGVIRIVPSVALVGPSLSKSELIIRGQTPENIIRVAFNNDKGQMLRLVDYTYPNEDNPSVRLNYTDFTYVTETSKTTETPGTSKGDDAIIKREYGTAMITFDADMERVEYVQVTRPNSKAEMVTLDYDKEGELIAINVDATATFNPRRITVDAALLDEAEKTAKGPAVPI